MLIGRIIETARPPGCRRDRRGRRAGRPSASVALEPRRVVGVGARDRATLGIEHVDPLEKPVPDVGVRDVDAGVEQRDRDAAPVEARDARQLGPAPGAPREGLAAQLVRRERGRIGRTDGIHAGHVAVALEQRERSAVDRSREAVEGSRVDEVGDELDPLARQPRGDLLLAGERGGRPAPHRRLGCPPARLGHAIGERRVLEDDDHPLADGDGAPLAVDEATPGRRTSFDRAARLRHPGRHRPRAAPRPRRARRRACGGQVA